jgi:hypothetical protein
MPNFNVRFRRTVTKHEFASTTIFADSQGDADAIARRVASRRQSMDPLPWKNGHAVTQSHEVESVTEVREDATRPPIPVQTIVKEEE